MIFDLFKKNFNLGKDAESFLSVTDLDNLLNFYSYLTKKYKIIDLQKYFGQKDFVSLSEQGKANLLFCPQLLPEGSRFEIQRDAVIDKYDEYVMLATVVGLQSTNLAAAELKIVFEATLSFLYRIYELQLSDYFIKIIANRILNTFLSFSTNIKSHDIYKTVALFINNKDFSELHKNFLLILYKYQINWVGNEIIKKEIGADNYSKLLKISDIKSKKREDITIDEANFIVQTYSYIPNLCNLKK